MHRYKFPLTAAISLIVMTVACLLLVYPEKIKKIPHKISIAINGLKKANIDCFQSIDIPLLIIQTEDGCDPSFTKVPSPTGMGKGIKENEYKDAYLRLSIGDSIIYESEGNTMTDHIKVRGNTSAYEEKKSFKLKLNSKKNLIVGSDHRVKKWTLLRTTQDVLKPIIGFELNKLLGIPYTPQYQYVNLVINNNYRGLYVLTEPISRDANRIKISKNGFLIENDAYWYLEDKWFSTNLMNDKCRYTIKYPPTGYNI